METPEVLSQNIRGYWKYHPGETWTVLSRNIRVIWEVTSWRRLDSP